MDDVVTRAEFDELRARVQALERERPARSTTADDRLLLVLASVVVAAAFNTAEVFEHAHVDAELATALRTSGLSSARQLGKFLRRRAGALVGDRELACIGEDRSGRVWCFVLAAEVPPANPRTP